MFLRFLGRIFLYFVIIPTVAPLAKSVLQSMLARYVEQALKDMKPEKREPFERYLRNTRRPQQDYRRPSTPKPPMGFQAH